MIEILHDMQWRHDAACADPSVDSTAFFPVTPEESARSMTYCAPICAACPVAGECLEHAVAFEKYGIWAGTSERERRRIRRQRGHLEQIRRAAG